MKDYPVLHLIVRHGSMGATLASIIVVALVALAGMQSLGWLVAPVALFAGAMTYVLGKSYAELVRLITEMLLPH